MDGKQAEINWEIRERLPETYKILEASKLTVHPYVYKVVLTGSRGLSGKLRENSDIDLSLLVDRSSLALEQDEEKALKEILGVTLSAWSSPIELDTAVVFDICNCQLRCFDSESGKCKDKGIDCIGLYKTQKGYNGYVPKIGINIESVYPMITVWERKQKVKEPNIDDHKAEA